MSRRARAVRIAASMMSSLLLQARNLVISVVVFRLFLDAETVWGTVSQVAAVVTLIALPAKLGLEFTAVQLVSRYRDDQPSAARAAFTMATWLRVGLTLVFAIPMLLAPGVVGALTGLGDVPHLVVVGGWLLLTTSFYEYVSFALSSADHFVGMMICRLAYALVNIGAIGVVVWTDPADPAQGVLWAQVAGGAAATLYGIFAMGRILRRWSGTADTAAEPVDVATGLPLLREVLSIALPLTLVTAGGQLFSYLDRVILPVLDSREELGGYAVASSVMAAAMFGTYAFRNVARTRLPGLLRRDPEGARSTLRATYRASLAVALWICAGIFTVADDLLLSLYGPDAANAASMLRWFAPWVVLQAHANFSATALVSADRPRTYAKLMGLLLVLNLGLNLALIPVLKGHGAVLASTLSYLPLAVLAYREVAEVYGGALWSWSAVAKAMPVTLKLLALAAAAGLCGVFVTGPTLAQAVAAGFVVTGVFGGLLFATGEVRAIRAAM